MITIREGMTALARAMSTDHIERRLDHIGEEYDFVLDTPDHIITEQEVLTAELLLRRISSH